MTRRHSRETENLQGIPVVYSIQSHNHLEYAVKVLVTTQTDGQGVDDILCQDENSEVNVHLSAGCGRVVAEAKTGLMETHEQLTFNRQVDGGLNSYGQYVEPAV